MKVAHILFSAPMICALRAGTKTQTRRLAAPRWAAGDLLVVREAFQLLLPLNKQPPSIMMRQTPIHYMADGKAPAGFGKGRPSIHMPTIASRLTLRVQEVRQEPLQAISEADAEEEGVVVTPGARGVPDSWHVSGIKVSADDPVKAYLDLWDHINGHGASGANPQVFATTFEVIHSNVEKVKQ